MSARSGGAIEYRKWPKNVWKPTRGCANETFVASPFVPCRALLLSNKVQRVSESLVLFLSFGATDRTRHGRPNREETHKPRRRSRAAQRIDLQDESIQTLKCLILIKSSCLRRAVRA